MKKGICFAVIMFFMMCSASYGELLNPSFEDWTEDAPDFWTEEVARDVNQSTIAMDGASSAEFDRSGSAANMGVFQIYDALAGQFYAFSAQLRSASVAGSMGIVISWYDDNGYIESFGPVYTEGYGDWEEVVLYGAKTPVGVGTVRAKVIIRAYCDYSFCGWADLISFYPVDCTDFDEDGYASEGGECGLVDCNDEEISINPGQNEICGNDVDENCTGDLDDRDYDGDGFFDEWCGGDDCDDEAWLVNPDAYEDCDNLIDDNCDGLIDLYDGDGDGEYADDCGGADCDDDDDTVYTGADEICDDGIDQDCDGADLPCGVCFLNVL